MWWNMPKARTPQRRGASPRAGFAKLADDHWLVNVITEDGVTGGEGRTQREALASLGLTPEEVDYLMRPENHQVENFEVH